MVGGFLSKNNLISMTVFFIFSVIALILQPLILLLLWKRRKKQGFKDTKELLLRRSKIINLSGIICLTVWILLQLYFVIWNQDLSAVLFLLSTFWIAVLNIAFGWIRSPIKREQKAGAGLIAGGIAAYCVISVVAYYVISYIG